MRRRGAPFKTHGIWPFWSDMKILISGQFYRDSFARNIAVTASRMGHDVALVEQTAVHRYLNGLWIGFWTVISKVLPQYDRKRQRELIKSAADFAPDLILLTYGTLPPHVRDRKSTRLNSSHEWISYAVFCLKKKKQTT